jgi:carboxylate-amine ligase
MDTGLQSARAKIFEALPNTGVPTAFDSYAEFDAFERTMVETDSIDDRGELWYDVRPHTGLGTVEVRTPDGQADPDRVMAFVEYVHALVTDLAARYEDGEQGREHRRELLDENKWRAIRHGQSAALLGREMDRTVDLGELVDRECERLGVDGIRDVYEAESGAEKQRRLHEDEGMDALCAALRL